ncbi:hypothetical protein BJ742DRAFT_838448 [Cladochytrium replicatum]|nr:hypothetical protein BJ742DRAFT_838448 [Cladochytrium replicatum]
MPAPTQESTFDELWARVDGDAHANKIQGISIHIKSSNDPPASAIVWAVPTNVLHPLRDTRLVPLSTPFLFVTNDHRNENSPKEQVEVDLDRVQRIVIGPVSENAEHLKLCTMKNTMPSKTITTPSTGRFPISQEIWKGISLSHARALSSRFALEKLPYLVFIFYSDVNESDGGHTAQKPTREGYLGYEWRNDSPVIYEITSSLAEHSEEYPSVDLIREQFDDICMDENDTPLQNVGFARYELLAESGFTKATRDCSSSITLDVAWPGVKRTLEAPSPSSSSVTMTIKAVSGSRDTANHGMTISLRRELDKLIVWDEYRRVEAEGGKRLGMWWNGCEEKEGTDEVKEDGNELDDGLGHENLEEDEEHTGISRASQSAEVESERPSLPISFRVEEFIEGLKAEATIRTGTDVSSTQAQLEDDLAVELGKGGPLPLRTDLDFTERFWLFAKDALTRNDLLNALHRVVSELLSQSLRPMVHKTNHTALANQVRECLKLSKMQNSAAGGAELKDHMEAVTATFNYWLEEPMEMAVEIGMMKLKRDYVHCLIGNNLVNWNTLEHFMDPSAPMDEQVRHLRCLQRVVEVWTLVRAHVEQFPPEVMRELIEGLLGYYSRRNAPLDREDETIFVELGMRKLSYGTMKVVNSVTSFEPSLWSVTMCRKVDLGGPVPRTVDISGTSMSVVLERQRQVFPQMPPTTIEEAFDFGELEGPSLLSDRSIDHSVNFDEVVGAISQHSFLGSGGTRWNIVRGVGEAMFY